MAASVQRFQPIIRSGGPVPHPECIASTLWVDALSLAANTAQTYTPPAGAVFLRLTSTAGPIYINFNATATVPATNITTGAASQMVLSQLGSIILPLPNTTLPMSVICAAASVVTIEAWN